MATMTMDFGTARRSSNAVRLTARGRVVARIAVAVLVAITAYTVLSFGKVALVSALSSAPAGTQATQTVVVQQGQTLWQIATHAMPGTDPREGIGRIRTLNGLGPEDAIVAGQELRIPAL